MYALNARPDLFRALLVRASLSGLRFRKVWQLGTVQTGQGRGTRSSRDPVQPLSVITFLLARLLLFISSQKLELPGNRAGITLACLFLKALVFARPRGRTPSSAPRPPASARLQLRT